MHFEKKSVLTKLQFNITDDQDLRLSYTANRSDGILYPAGPMDADYDDSDIYTLGYTIRDLGAFSKQLDLDYYYSKVDHPMSTKRFEEIQMDKFIYDKPSKNFNMGNNS